MVVSRAQIIRQRLKQRKASSAKAHMIHNITMANKRKKKPIISSTEEVVILGANVNGIGTFDPIEPSVQNENSYYKDLRKITQMVINEKSNAAIKAYEKEAKKFNDELSAKIFRISSIAKLAQIKRIAYTMVDKENKFNRVQFLKSMDNAIGVNLNKVLKDEGIEKVIEKVTADNVSLIKSIPVVYQERLNKILMEGFKKQTNALSIKKQILELDQVSYRRARFIARDQVSKLSNTLTKTRFEEAGISRYIWVTSQDERVRESHMENAGKTFSYDNPPETGHPGEDPGCRCIQKPDFSSIKGLAA